MPPENRPGTTTTQPERRTVPGLVVLRAAAEGSKSPGTLTGYAAVFDTPSSDLGGFVERIAPGAFRGCMGDDVRSFFNHDENHVLGRSAAGTLRFEEDGQGLRFEVDLPNTSVGRDVAESVSRKDVTGCSFMFTVESDQWEWNDAGPALRTVTKVSRLYELGPVCFPAYEATSVDCRSFERAKKDRDAARSAAAEPLRSQAKARQRLAEAFLPPPLSD